VRNNKICSLYSKFRKRHGLPVKFWPNWCAERKDKRLREIIAIGAILTQRTSWRNADLALENLQRENLLSLEKISKLKDLEKLTSLIKPAGFYQTKPKRLKTLASFIIDNYGNILNFKKEELTIARKKLLSLYGIGPETADTILLYALDKPAFIIDEYTKRLVKKEKLAKVFDYDFLKSLFGKNLPKDFRIYRDFHALIIIDLKGEQGSVMKRF